MGTVSVSKVKRFFATLNCIPGKLLLQPHMAPSFMQIIDINAQRSASYLQLQFLNHFWKAQMPIQLAVVPAIAV